MTMKSVAERMKVIHKFQPRDINGAAQGGNYNHTSLRNYQGAYFLLSVGAHSGDAVAFTITQAKNVEGNGSKSLAYDKYYSNDPDASPQQEEDNWRETTGAAGTFNITANTNYLIPVRPGELDVSGDFDCIRGELAAGSASTIVSLALVLHDGPEGITDNVKHIPSAAVNRMPN